MRRAGRLLTLGLVLLAAGAAQAKVRVAVPEFQVDAAASPTLPLQLQDGFVLALARAGTDVVDPLDTARRLEGHPELERCDTSDCLKTLGRLLGVKYVVRVRVDVTGNSYKAVARVFSTEGEAPGALPVANRSKTCDVCTVAEARDVVMRLANELKPYFEEPPPPPPPPPVLKPPSLKMPVVAAMLGGMAVAAGFAVLASMGDCGPEAGACDENRSRATMAGTLIGVGVTVAAMGTYVTVQRARTMGSPTTTVSLALRW